jgi:hypothetical protein
MAVFMAVFGVFRPLDGEHLAASHFSAWCFFVRTPVSFTKWVGWDSNPHSLTETGSTDRRTKP